MINVIDRLTTKKLVFLFTLCGVIVLLFRVYHQSAESVPTGDSLWELTMSVDILVKDEFPTVYMAIPMDSPNNRVISQMFTHLGLNIKHLYPTSNDIQRGIVATAKEKGKLSLTGDYQIHISKTKRWQKWFVGISPPTTEQKLLYLDMPAEFRLQDAVLNNLLNSLRTNIQDQKLLVEKIYDFVNQRILSDKHAIFQSVENTLARKRANALGKANVMIALCRASQIPSRLVTGVVVQEMLDTEEHYWVEVYTNHQWLSYDPSAGYAEEIPANYLKLNETGTPLAYQKDGTPLDVEIDIVQLPTPSGLMGTGEKRFLDIFDLTRLPVGTQFLLSSLLLLPFGAFITNIFRNIIGVHTYGTFTASMLALAMIYADWITVSVVASTVAIIGVAGRSVMPEKMTRVPRLSIVLTIVAIAMVLSVSMMDYFSLNPSATVVLLPVIIMTGLVDRVYSNADEKGVAVAIYRLIWTCLVAAVCFGVFSVESLRQLLIQYPEVHLFTLALILLCNAYHWKKLTALEAFQWMREPIHNKTKKLSSVSNG